MIAGYTRTYPAPGRSMSAGAVARAHVSDALNERCPGCRLDWTPVASIEQNREPPPVGHVEHRVAHLLHGSGL
jgi:hypothetical protein